MSLIVIALLLAGLGWAWVRSHPPAQRRSARLKVLALGALVVLAFLALTGRYHLVLGLLAGVLPFIGRLLPGLLRGRGPQPQAGNQSRVTSDILEMTLDHDSGEMDGSVLKGPYADRRLAELGETEFIELLRYCRQHDDDSARLLETYLDRRFGDSWRADDPDTGDEAAGAASGTGAPLSEHEALDILGLEAGASREEIIQAHRRLMQKVHPDRGGSTYLAARINEAKTRLLG